MPLSKIKTNSIADDAITSATIADNAVGSSALDLTANYTFTGTVKGVNAYSVFAETPADKSWTTHNYSRAAWVGADGYTRSGGYIYSGNDSYSGEGMTTAFDGASNHVIRIRLQAIGADTAYWGLGIDIAASISDSQAATDAGDSIYGLTGTWTGASSVSHLGGYFNTTSSDPPAGQKELYINIWTAGSGASRKLYATWSPGYVSDPQTGFVLESGNTSPPNGTKIINTSLSVGAGGYAIGTKDFALLVGEAGGGNHNWIIETYGTY